ncbi:Permease of the drug/metabolite transporter (DMT) superfamily [Acidisarcina polymorpha]|uniref:Permease of the drug/metabolite transporter (DMT) superfamily n=1 Tax=Acidisarcina polymorpha TaxID=2211140 RepID=A0A2Z5G473_9BACT|nr:DMT family transporter [Acidisarcina polymorpha]AXC13942.1 Permease of the drug/metabolite transporter (DMT) superfamily [Acidisarcina polymorpha]
MKASQGAKKLTLPLCIGITLVLWASSFPAIRAGLSGYAPQHLVLLRLLTASGAFILIAPFARIRVPKPRHLPSLLLLGLIGIGGYNLALSYGETHVPSGTASLLVNCAPVITALLAMFFLKERIRPRAWLGLIVSLGGVAVVVTTLNSRVALDPWALLVVLAAALQAVFFVLQKRLLASYRPLELTCYSMWSGTLASLFFLPGFVNACRTSPLHATLSVVYLGVFPAAFAYLTWAVVLSRLPASKAGSLLYIVPLLAFVIAWFWLGERPQISTLCGGVLALAGVVLVTTARALPVGPAMSKIV